MITITLEQFQRALDAIGAVPIEVAYPKEYAEAVARCSQEMADEIDREVLAELLAAGTKEVPVEPEHLPGIWSLLKDLEPYDSGASLHVCEARYSLHGVRYVVYWEIGGSDVPLDIAILKD